MSNTDIGSGIGGGSAKGGAGRVPASAGAPASIMLGIYSGGRFEVRKRTVLNSPESKDGKINTHETNDTPGMENVVPNGSIGPIIAVSTSPDNECENGGLSRLTLAINPAEVTLAGLILRVSVLILELVVFSSW